MTCTFNKSIRLLAVLAVFMTAIHAAPRASAVSMGSLYDGTSGDVACSSGFFSIVSNEIIGQTSCSGTVNIPEGVTSIAAEAFLDATSVTTLIFANSVTSMGDRAFSGATSLRSITFGSGLQELASGVFSGAISLRSVTIPSTLTGIGGGAFSGTTSLTRVIIPATIFFIWDSSFANATSLRSIYFLGDAPSLVGLTPFLNVPTGASAYVNEGSLSSFGVAEGELWNGLIVQIGEPVIEEPVEETVEQPASEELREVAVAKREAEKQSARLDIVRNIQDAKNLTVDLFNKADIAGINSSNIADIQSELLALPSDSQSDIKYILKIARKYEVVGKISSENVDRILPNTYIEIGLIPADSPNKAALAKAVKSLSPFDRDSYAEIKAAIEEEMVRIKDRADRLATVLARYSSGEGN